MRRRQNTPVEPLAGTERELVAMTAQLTEIHNDLSLPDLQHAVQDMKETNMDRLRGIGAGRTSRRTFLLGTGAAAVGGVLLAACSSSSSSSSTKAKSPAASSSSSAKYPADLTGDLKVAALAASLENLAVYAYGAGISAATAGKLGTVPPAVVTFAETAKSQHTEHAAAWNSILTAAGKHAVTVTDPKLTPTVNQKFAQVTNVTDLANLALLLENVAAQTYQVEASALKGTKAIETAATIQPVEMQHAAILYFVLGEYPGIQTAKGTPLAFNPTSLATS